MMFRLTLALIAAAFAPAAAVPRQAASAPAPATETTVSAAQVLATYPHDPAAFTEGLLIHDGVLYESTGREGQSVIRRVDLATGRQLATATIPAALFGEGIAAFGHQLFSVTWHGGQGFRWSLPALKRTGTFRYAGEGWAMTADADHLILSDGTPVLRFLDPATQQVVRTLTVTWRGRRVTNVNELEYVDDEILANIWMTPLIARIDPASGVVTGWIDLTAIVDQLGLGDRDSVANGIAWDAQRRALYVTGKNWPSLYRIALPPRAPAAAPANGGR